MLTFDRSLPMILNRALDAIMPPYRDLFSRYDLTEQQWRVLRVVWSSDKYKSVDLASHTLLATASLVGILDRLEKKGSRVYDQPLIAARSISSRQPKVASSRRKSVRR